MKKKLLISCLVASIIVLIEFLTWFLFFDKKIVIKLNGNEVENLCVFSNYLEQGAEAYYKSRLLKGLKLENIKINSNVDTDKLGEYKVDYEIEYKNKKETVTRKVNIIDDIPPKIETEENINVCPNVDLKNYELKYKANDNYDGDMTNKIIKNYY